MGDVFRTGDSAGLHLVTLREWTRVSGLVDAGLAVEVSGSAGRGRPKKTWEEVIKMDLRERRVSKDLARNRLAWKSIF